MPNLNQTSHFDIKDPRFGSLVFPKTVPATLTTAGALTLTTAQILGGLILRDPAGAGRTDTTPTAAQLAAAIPGVMVGTSFEFHIRNNAGGAFTITVGAGAGVTISGTATIAQSNSKTFRAVFTNVTAGSEALTLYSIGSFVF